MKKKIQRYLSGEREGFSLIELIIVIAIMAILIGVIALVVLPYLSSSKVSKDHDTLNQVATAFKSAVAVTKAEATIGGVEFADLPEAVRNKTNDLLDGTVQDAINGLSSDNAIANKKFIFVYKKGEGCYVSIGEKAGIDDGEGGKFTTKADSTKAGATKEPTKS